MKKILSLILAAMMVFSVVPAVFADDAVTTAAEESAYQDAIDFLALPQIGLYKGNGEGDAAAELVTRWQMALFVSRFITGETADAYWVTTENDSGFTDVEDMDDYVLGAIAFASQKGIVNGIGGSLFDPEGGIEYRQAITMLVRALGYNYKASGYPWSYINKAREIGLLDGISGIGYEETIKREVVAQLLYNAFFAEVDGETVAETVYGVGSDIVMITASNKVAYDGKNTVSKPGYVQFAVTDAEGDPVGAKYHVPMSMFGLANADDANAAVGMPYFVYYVDGCADIIAAKSLYYGEYWNLGNEKTEISTSKTTITLGGESKTMVTKYSYLNKDKTWEPEETKAYIKNGNGVTGTFGQYVFGYDGNIYDINNPTVPYAYYSAAIGAYYMPYGNSWKILTEAEVAALKATGTEFKGFQNVTSATISAYSYAIAADANMDGSYDRVIVKDYKLGKLTKDKVSDKPGFQLYAGNTNANGFASTAELSVKVEEGYRFTGMKLEDVAAGSYIIYYLDKNNKEVDILSVIGAKTEGADTYYAKGYVRTFDITKDQIVIDDQTMTYGYDKLNNSPLKGKDFGGDAGKGKNIANNYALLNKYYNQYVTYLVVDNKVVFIDNVGASNNYVIIESIVAFEDDGIVVNAYTTVDDAQKEIKISEINGWTVGGFDYYLYYLSNMFAPNSYKLPIETYKYYKVVYANDGVYNITLPNAPTTASLNVNAYGFITGVNNKGAIAAANYTTTTDGDYWLILDTSVANAPKIYSFKGKLGAIALNDMAIYKAGVDADYVLATATGVSDLENLITSNVKYFVYNKDVNFYGNNYFLNQVNPYNYQLFMTNALTGGIEAVTVDPKLASGSNNYFGQGYSDVFTTADEGKIFKAVDGVIVSKNAVSLADVATFYAGTMTYQKLYTATVADATIAKIRTAILTQILDAKYGVGNYPAALLTDKAQLNSITILGFNSANVLKATADKDKDQGIVCGAAGTNTTAFYVVGADGKATAWVVGADRYHFVADAKTVTAQKGLEETDTRFVDDADGSKEFKDITANYVINTNADKAVVTVNFNGEKVTDTANKNIEAELVYAIAAGTLVKASKVTPIVENGSIVAITFEFDNYPSAGAVRLDVAINGRDGGLKAILIKAEF